MQNEFLGDRYQLQDQIGRGSMATVYRGRDIRMDHVVAIKVWDDTHANNQGFMMRFQREAKTASYLQHPNIVVTYDYGQTNGKYYIVMELVEGSNLRRYLRGRGVLDIDRAITIAHDVALGLGAAHRRGVVHCDVKPQNILVGQDGSIKLTDFGMALLEQTQDGIITPAADVYSLGIVMYQMLTSRIPFDGDNPVAVAIHRIQDPPISPRLHNPNIPPALEAIILRCLEKVPEMRFRDGSQLARALETWL